MTVKPLAHEDRKVATNDLRRITAPYDKIEALDKSAVAELSATLINAMTRDELVRMIRVASLPVLLCPDLDRHLPFYDRETLTRLAYLARRCCENQGS